MERQKYFVCRDNVKYLSMFWRLFSIDNKIRSNLVKIFELTRNNHFVCKLFITGEHLLTQIVHKVPVKLESYVTSKIGNR